MLWNAFLSLFFGNENTVDFHEIPSQGDMLLTTDIVETLPLSINNVDTSRDRQSSPDTGAIELEAVRNAIELEAVRNALETVSSDASKATLQEFIYTHAPREFQETEYGRLLDLSDMTYDEVSAFLHELTATHNMLLHGSNSEAPYTELQIRQANDASKEFGNHAAVYASSEPAVALMRAILNKSYLSTTVFSYSFGENGMRDNHMTFKASPNAYRLIAAHDPHLVEDGYVYVLDAKEFINEKDGDPEYRSNKNQTPLAIIKVGKTIGQQLFVVGQGENDTVFPLSEDNLKELYKKNAQTADEVLTSIHIKDSDTLTGSALVARLKEHPFFTGNPPSPQAEALLHQIEVLPASSRSEFTDAIARVTSGL